jgi:hypothetical protein
LNSSSPLIDDLFVCPVQVYRRCIFVTRHLPSPRCNCNQCKLILPGKPAIFKISSECVQSPLGRTPRHTFRATAGRFARPAIRPPAARPDFPASFARLRQLCLDVSHRRRCSRPHLNSRLIETSRPRAAWVMPEVELSRRRIWM